MKVSLYVREHSTRKYRKAKSTEPAGTVYVLRYGGTWETPDAENRNDARVAQLRKEAALLEGWRPKVEKRKPAGLMLDAAMDAYLSEVKAGRKKKTHQAYDTALRYFYECIGNKQIKDILVASPALFQVRCKTPRQIELANAFCRYLELANWQTEPPNLGATSQSGKD